MKTIRSRIVAPSLPGARDSVRPRTAGRRARGGESFHRLLAGLAAPVRPAPDPGLAARLEVALLVLTALYPLALLFTGLHLSR
jgi:hypothetical protein